MGFYHIGPIDGHSFDHLLPVLRNVSRQCERPGPDPCRHAEGQGLSASRSPADKYHGVNKFDVITGAQAKASPTPRLYLRLRGRAHAGGDPSTTRSLRSLPPCRRDGPRQVRLGASLTLLRCRHSRAACGDFAAGLAAEDTNPLRRFIPPSCNAPMIRLSTTWPSRVCRSRFPIDPAGFVGADGPTHAGSFDTTYLATLPGLRRHGGGRRGGAEAYGAHRRGLRRGSDFVPAIRAAKRRRRVAGARRNSCDRQGPDRQGRGGKVGAAFLRHTARRLSAGGEDLDAAGLSTTVADARFAQPLDHDLIRQLARPSRGSDHHRGRGGRAASQATCCSSLRKRASSTAASRCAPWSCPTFGWSRQNRKRCTPVPGLDRAGIVSTVFKALGQKHGVGSAPPAEPSRPRVRLHWRGGTPR